MRKFILFSLALAIAYVAPTIAQTVNPGGKITAGTTVLGGCATANGILYNNSNKIDCSAGTITSAGAIAGTQGTITSASATSLTVGRQGATSPAFVVDSSTASQIAGLSVKGAATGGTVAVTTTDSGSNSSLTINAKGNGTIGIGSASTGTVTITPATLFGSTVGGITSATAGSFPLTITNTASTSADIAGISLFAANVNAAKLGGYIMFGQAGNTRNGGVLGFRWQSSGSTTNTWEMSFAGVATPSLSGDGAGNFSAGADAGALLFRMGGATSSFPAIKRAAAVASFRLADDSADAAIKASGATFSGLSTGTNADFLCLSAAGVVLLQTTACTISSARFKRDIEVWQKNPLEIIDGLQPVTFYMREKNVDPNGDRQQLGLTAENVAAVDPQLAIYENDMVTPKSYRQESLIAVLVAAVQMQQQQIEELRAAINVKK